MDSPTAAPKIINSGDVVVIEEGWRLVAKEICHARAVKRIFFPRSKSWDVFEAVVVPTGQTVIIEVEPWTRRAKLLEVKPAVVTKKGGHHAAKQ